MSLNLFDTDQTSQRSLPPLAERMRPRSLDEFVGQEDLVGEQKILRTALRQGTLFSLILWGPPGSGKTTLATICAHATDAKFHQISAVSSGVKDVRQVIQQAEHRLSQDVRTILFIDEIHRFNKAQQDALLHAVEQGSIILIGATTENPSFEVISPLLSRCRVLRLQPLTREHLQTLLHRALTQDLVLSQMDIRLDPAAETSLLESAGGDARRLLNLLEIALQQAESAPGADGSGPLRLSKEQVLEALQHRTQLYDKKGDYHYDTISAFIKSIRGSDPDAAVYWLAVMLEGGEDPKFLARRLIISASEDVGNADPYGLTLATSAFTAIDYVGMPEAAIILAQATTYLAGAAKSNAAYLAVKTATASVRQHGSKSVPLHLRNAPTELMKSEGYQQGYQYPHDFPDHFVRQSYLPEDLDDASFYHPTRQGREKFLRDRLSHLWNDRYQGKDSE